MSPARSAIWLSAESWKRDRGHGPAPDRGPAAIYRSASLGGDPASSCVPIHHRPFAGYDIARRCRAIVMANFAGTLLVDGAGVGLAAFGFLNPVLAAFIHVTSELLFLLNSARLLRGWRARAPVAAPVSTART